MNANHASSVQIARERERSALDRDRATALSIAKGVARRWGVPLSDVVGRSCHSEHRAARCDWYSCLWGSGWSYKRIGRATGRDHSTITASVGHDFQRMGIARPA